MKNIKINKYLFLLMSCILMLVGLAVTRIYSASQIQKEFEIIKKEIIDSNVSNIAAKVDGKNVSSFPSKSTNYKVESIDCTNGVTAEWNAATWSLSIVDMNATSTKCTVNFNSLKTSSENSILYTKEQLFGMNEEYKNMNYLDLIDKIYPIGSIYMSISDDTITKVQSKLGGTWVKYSEGTKLISANSTYPSNSTGGSSKVTIGTSNIPSHNHSIPSVSATTSAGGAHTPTLYIRVAGYSGWTYSLVDGHCFNWANTVMDMNYGERAIANTLSRYPIVAGAVAAHTHTATFAASTSGATGSGTSVNIQNPYTAVYMYKRTA